jgi:hypothetical protein
MDISTGSNIFFSNSRREHRLVSQIALRSGYHVANMVLPTPVGPPPRSINIAESYHSAPLANEDPGPNITMSLVNLFTDTGSERTNVAAVYKALPELTDFIHIQAAELRRLSGMYTFACIAPQTHVGQVTTTVVCENGRTRTFEPQKYKTKNNIYWWSHGYQVGADTKSSTCTKQKESHSPEATKDNIMGADT